MSHIPIVFTILVASVLSGCVSGPRPDPSTQASPVKEQRPARELLARGREAAARGDAVRAEQYLSLAIAQGADRRVVMPILLRACILSSHLRAALNHAESYLLAHPDDDALRYLVANVHLGLGQVVAARRELGLLLQRDGSNPDAHYLLGIIDASNSLEVARAHFLKAIEHSPEADLRTEIRSRLAELRLREPQPNDGAEEPDANSGGAK